MATDVFATMGEVMSFIFGNLSSIFDLYTTQIVLAIVPALWLLRKIVKIFTYL